MSYNDQYFMERCIEELVVPSEFEDCVVRSFLEENNFQFQVSNIKKVENIFLEVLYEMKKAEIKSRFRVTPEELFLIHVTSVRNVRTIVKDNFDWRKIVRGKFGLGTSFSKDAQYADHHANNCIGDSRALIITKVLVTQCTGGQYKKLQLDAGFDTSVGNKRKVFVKFYDNEMLPMFVVYYNSSSAAAAVSRLDRPLSSSPTKPSLISLLANMQRSQMINLIRRELVRSESRSLVKQEAHITELDRHQLSVPSRIYYSHDSPTYRQVQYPHQTTFLHHQVHVHRGSDDNVNFLWWLVFIGVILGGILLFRNYFFPKKKPLPTSLQWMATYGGVKGEQFAEWLVSLTEDH